MRPKHLHCWELLLLLLLLLLRHGMGGGVHQVTPNGIASTCLCDTRLLQHTQHKQHHENKCKRKHNAKRGKNN